MRSNARGETLKKNYIQSYQFLIEEYEQVKAKRHAKYQFAKGFYKAQGTCPQTFLKYCNRYKQSGGNDISLLPGKRGPKYKSKTHGWSDRESGDPRKEERAESV